MTTHSIKIYCLLLSILIWMGFLLATGFQYQQFHNNHGAEVLGVSTLNNTPVELEMTIPASEVIDIELPKVEPTKASIEQPPTQLVEQPQNTYIPPVYTEPEPKTETSPETIIQTPQPTPDIKEPIDEPVENPNGSGGWSNDLECYKANPHSYWDGFECVDPRV
jgi:outer membrane biosynthesis protein TonB